MAPQDDDNKDFDSDTSGKLKKEQEQLPLWTSRKESMKQGGYKYPKESKEDHLSEAGARILEALLQVHKSVHSNREGKRDIATLYVGNSFVGNSEYYPSKQDLSEALDPIFQKIHMVKITITRVKSQSLYGLHQYIV
jgi:hypothetical protein